MLSPQARVMKQKIQGVLIRSARMQVGLRLEETARQMAISPERLQEYELGRQEASLPELEALARIYNVPVSYFWSEERIKSPDRAFDASKRIPLRRKIVGALLRKARLAAGKTPAELAAAVNLGQEDLLDFELGRQAIPFSTLEMLAEALSQPLTYFLEEADQEQTNGRIAEPESTPEDKPAAPQPAPTTAAEAAGDLPPELAWLADMPEDVRAFLADPANTLYLKLSMRLHGLSADTLRRLAEGILDITY